MDGLLVDSEPLWRQAMIDVFARHGVHLSDDLCRTTKGMFVVDVACHWHERSPWPGPGPAAVAQEIVEAVADLLARRSELKPGVSHALSFCRARVPQLALASSSSSRLIDVVLARFDLARWFDVVHSAESEPAGKPDPAVFLTTAALLGVSPTACVVLEDSPAGVAAATAAGMGCIAVPEADEHALVSFAGAHVVLGSLESLDQGVWRRLESRVA